MEKKNLVVKAKEKVTGLVNYNEKDLKKLEKRAEKANRDAKVLNLLIALIKDPQDEETTKAIRELEGDDAKAFEALCKEKKIRFAVVAGVVTVIGVGLGMTAKAGTKKKPIDVDYEEVEEDDESEVEETEDEDTPSSEDAEE